MEYTPVIIIGPGRSGTNMLRDIITSIESFETWDCDEINPIWRYGNRDYPIDELPVKKLNSKIIKYIRGRFNDLQKDTGASFIVEKTCANSLRLDYVFEIFPEAKYIIINRDGRDVTASAMKRWGSIFELKYTLKKLRYVPFSDLFYYVSKFGLNRLKKIGLRKKSLSFWGPLYKGIENDVLNKSTMEVCANQWKHCVENTLVGRQNIPKENIFDIKYENFVSNPEEQMKGLLNFLNVNSENYNIKELTKDISFRSVGSHSKIYSNAEIILLNNILGKTLQKLNYKI